MTLTTRAQACASQLVSQMVTGHRMQVRCNPNTDTKRTGSVMYAPPANVPVSVACDVASCCLHAIIVCSHGMCSEGTFRMRSLLNSSLWLQRMKNVQEGSRAHWNKFLENYQPSGGVVHACFLSSFFPFLSFSLASSALQGGCWDCSALASCDL